MLSRFVFFTDLSCCATLLFASFRGHFLLGQKSVASVLQLCQLLQILSKLCQEHRLCRNMFWASEANNLAGHLCNCSSPWFIMVDHSSPWWIITMVDHGRPWFTMVYHDLHNLLFEKNFFRTNFKKHFCSNYTLAAKDPN